MLAATLVSAAATGAQAAPQLRLDTAFASVNVGQVFSVVLTSQFFDLTGDGKVIDNVSGGQNMRFSFSSDVLDVLSVSISPRWTFTAANRTGTIDRQAGTITGLSFGSFPATTDDAFEVATFTMKALAPGNGTLALMSGQIVGRVAGLPSQLIQTSSSPALVSVLSAVPEPQQWALLVVGLCGMALHWARRR